SWLNTDDLIDIEGFLKTAAILESGNSTIDYIYGDIEIIDEHSVHRKLVAAGDLELDKLVNRSPGIYQPGSFFRKEFTDKIGMLEKYRCCFDYEYILRLLKNGAKTYACNF